MPPRCLYRKYRVHNRLTKHDLLLTLFVSTVFVVLAQFSIKVLMPMQDAAVGEFQHHTLLLYLPHGVRVLAAWLYGWKSIIYLFPGQLMTHSFFWGTSSLLSFDVLNAIGGACVGYLGVLVASHVLRGNNQSLWMRPWVEILLAGVIASLANSCIKHLLHAMPLGETVGVLVGDILGLMLLMVLLLYVFRIERKVKTG